ncbi:biotin--acetyl-CoA-carboxylase ligase [Anaplasma marginale str. Dawn]|uniref:Biotin-(Acetyl-CoA carboxylase) (BirA) n=1 Tax=Anaplasma marginale (strain Florida) TaxID=320483 RepID=B9KI43_ANAMF|nr:biotin--[acetyl-CoA-carboxylase] ligase [Anaplasma marginale]ACM49155.1 biotin-(acetyl-CoA carboxylase) (birA) [Anaplasma marginale str. Florida]AGZ78711.1 biotin--acetyl-CoA-carboxylase ligase [Anaplasma marginale str. Gypsy Plains]AGZ79551.1 biotin--acetyl-CoA-carboxylase ligase [Anaplasma marginale str. Dawn]AXW83907.1 biotin--[acetyl-CoA-carboxylase] ligase [Anaplasma marginale]KAA8473084.1 biotin--[acetyl-CoA-carboxylase] ligase [Anaplasma marginale]
MHGFVIHHTSVSRSTNLEAIELAQSGAPDGTVIIADEQTSGTGRYGREWHSPKGNLYCSIITRRSAQVAALSFLSSLAVGVTLEQVFEAHNCSTKNALIRYKWPNDVMVDGKKISGVLIKTKMIGGEIDWAVCGIGVNMYAPPPYAASLHDYIPELKLSNLELLDLMLQNFAKLLDVLETMGFAQLRSLWMRRGHTPGDKIRVITNNNMIIEGKFVNIDTHGAMVLESDGGIPTAVDYGEIL